MFVIILHKYCIARPLYSTINVRNLIFKYHFEEGFSKGLLQKLISEKYNGIRKNVDNFET